ncbi:XtrA/YqaO family protein [Margalitia sp. FSL K6-0131]|uniref:XtrA/YqaO family protein n=1 Tax=Margalitia sp. FSL K6-0131 TaxID=2954604 RepID=UPI0030FCB0A4
MRFKDLIINPSTMILEIDIIEQNGSFATVVCDGKTRIALLKEDGETNIFNHHGKIKHVKRKRGKSFN